MFDYKKLQFLLERYPETTCFWVAYSGGLDSQVLLHSLSRLLPTNRLRAIHVNHGWHVDAAKWATTCQQTCGRLGIPCEVVCINIQPKGGESPEAYARQMRYAAIAPYITKGDCLLTAHHRDDQAETLLLQLLRGTGLRGLASMPISYPFSKGYHIRPLLGYSRRALYQYAKTQQLTWIEDSSNTYLRFSRNFIRHRVLPILHQRWPQASKILARVAGNMAEAHHLLEELAYEDWKLVQGSSTNRVQVSCLLHLSPARRRHVLRYWLSQLHFPLPSQRQLQQIERLLISKIDASPQINWGGVQLRRYGDDLYATVLEKEPLRPAPFSWILNKVAILPHQIGFLTAEQVLGQGIACSAIKEGQVTVNFRQGGERLHVLGRSGSHPLKKLFQEWRVPPWQRQKIPLIYYQEQLIAVVGYGVHPHFTPKQDEWGFVIRLQSMPLFNDKKPHACMREYID